MRPQALSVVLVDTASPDQPGSMRAYAQTLQQALRRHAQDIDVERISVAGVAGQGTWARRLESLAMLARTGRLRSRSPDVWHVLDGSRAYIAHALVGRPVVVTAHDVIPLLQARGDFSAAPAVGAAARVLWRANARSTRRAAAVVCDSEATQRDVGTLLGAHRSRVVPLPLRPELAAQSGAGATIRVFGRVLHVGNNGFYKNRQQVLRMFAELRPELAHELVMLGPPPSSELRQLAEGLGIAGRLRWVEDAGDAEVVRWYQSSGVLLFPSLYEGFGWPVLEAMAFGLPVVVANTGSLPEVVGSACVCLPPSDSAAFVAAAERLLGSDLAWAEASSAGLQRASHFSEANFAEQMREVYIEAARVRGTARKNAL